MTNARYRTFTCNDLAIEDVGQDVRLAGWIHKKRNHGGLMFIDLRDHYGITQLVVDASMAQSLEGEGLRLESVVSIDGKVRERPAGTLNAKLATGAVEVEVKSIHVLNHAEELPVPVAAHDNTYPEDMRLKYRFLDLRRPELHRNIVLRSDIIDALRESMKGQGFREYQTPILTASSPEGARDFLVPSRLHPGKFYALPQAPQQFKQLLMVAGFDKYFQIAPCFRDEASRSDRSPGEFYQLDLEMSFVEQDDIFQVTGEVVHDVFSRFSPFKSTGAPYDPNIQDPQDWVKIPYRESIARFGTDKPDLRNPLEFRDVTEEFRKSNFQLFANMIDADPKCRIWGILAPNFVGGKFAKDMNNWAVSQGQGGLAMVYPLATGGLGGPVVKALGENSGTLNNIQKIIGMNAEDGLAFVAGDPDEFYKFAGLLRTKLAEELLPHVFKAPEFKFCWIVDFPMYELDEQGKVAFSHNPFSMPQGGMRALLHKDPLDILAYQYDLVCNGIELSSGAIRNHEPDTMLKAFELAGYSNEEVEKNFSGMLNAFRYGAPPHGGIAPGVDRMVMLLAQASNIREIIAFPLDAQGRDLMMNAPNEVTPLQLKELGIKHV
jgi:aspartyl-tRNA synthetase